jgi:exonuclease-1
MLLHFGVIPYIIFDGDYLPSKAGTEKERSKRREDSKKAGLELLKAGKTALAYQEFQKAVDVTPEMARQLIDDLKKVGVQYVVAPYEADAQMVYLERKGIIDGILSEDSDLLVFGAKCLLTKLDQYGNCIEINKKDFSACREITLTGWSDTEFRHMAILSGCDYLASITNMGLKTAYRMLRKHKTIEKVIRMLQFDGKFFVPKGYLEEFYRAEHTFLHQRVFCPIEMAMVLHTQPEFPIDEEAMPYIGAYVEPKVAQGVARGDLNPVTKLPIVVGGGVVAKNPSTPWTSKPQAKQSTSSDNLKKGKVNETFFKPRRVPLAELDPNCFTPSPSQQETLLRNRGPWQGSAAPRPYLHRAVTEPELPRSAPQPVRSVITRTHIRTPTISEPRPLKRARLCADVETSGSPTGSQKTELARSRFFTSTAPQDSPSVGRNVKSKRSKNQDINIFSDDSVEEIMRDLPDFDGFTKKAGKSGQKFQIFEEQGMKAAGISKSPCLLTSAPTIPDSIPTSQDSAPSLVSSMPLTSSTGPSTPDESISMYTVAESVNERFSFVPTEKSTQSSSTKVESLYTPKTTPGSVRPSRIPLAVKANVSASRTSLGSTKATLSPLQRLGATATSRQVSRNTPPVATAAYVKPSLSRRSLLGRVTVPFPEVANDEPATLVDPTLIPLPLPDEAEDKALQNGSEDMIIHDSEGEEEDLSPNSNDTFKINFGRFVYAG